MDWHQVLVQSRHHSDRAAYVQALDLLRDAVPLLTGADRLQAELEIVCVTVAQGYIRDALDHLLESLQSLSKIPDAREKSIHVQMRMEACLLEPAVTTHFQPALERADALRLETANFETKEELEATMIETALLYAKLRFLSGECHEPVAPSELESAVSWIESISYKLIEAGRFREAQKLVCGYGMLLDRAPKLKVNNISYEPWNRMANSLLSSAGAPPLVKAGIMVQLAQRGEEKLDEAYIAELEDNAAELYRREEHLAGATDIQCQRIIRLVKKDHTNFTDEILEELKGCFATYEAIDNIVSFEAAVNGISAQIPHWLGFEIQLSLSDINDQLTSLSGAALASHFVRFRLIGMWLTRSGTAARAVEASEAMYADLENGDARFLQGYSAYCASLAYIGLQDRNRAQVWAERAAALWADDYPDLRANATNAILQARLHVSLGSSFNHSMAVEEVCSYAEAELETDVENGLVLHAHQKAEMIIAWLLLRPTDEAMRRRWTAKAEELMNIVAKMDSMESDLENAAALQLQSVQAAQAKDWERAMAELDAAVELFMKHKKLVEAANTRMMQSRIVYQEFLLSPTGNRLQRCVDLVDIALELFTSIDNMTFITTSWGYKASTLYTGWTLGWVSSDAVLEALTYAEEAWARERADMTVFASLEAVSRRQQLTSVQNLRILYHNAFQICLKERRLVDLWDWVQRGKARSLSDQLGVDSLIPAELRNQALACPDKRKLVEKSEELPLRIMNSSRSSRLTLRGELNIVHGLMRKDPLLNAILDIKNGASVKMHQISKLADEMKTEFPGRDMVFVDWVEHSGVFWVVVLRGGSDQPSVVECALSVDEVHSWKRQWLDVEAGEELSALEEGDLFPEDHDEFSLRALDGLVAPLEDLSRPDDVLVFSPTGVLHSIPLHALWVPSRMLILERNPILYSASLTTFWQCCRRAMTIAGLPSRISGAQEKSSPPPEYNTKSKWTLAAVYEKGPGHDFYPREQGEIYSLIPQTAARIKADSVLGTKVTRQFVRGEMEQSSLFLFYGHCFLNRQDLTTQGIELGDGILTVREIFDLTLHAPHVALIACDSASQGISTGDEPLGIVTALLCAGAGSVLGTIWPTASLAGRRFISELYGSSMLAGDACSRLQGSSSSSSSSSTKRVVDMAERTRRAVLALRSELQTSQPYHWAAFVLHGCWGMMMGGSEVLGQRKI